MNPTDIVIVLIVVAIVAVAAWRFMGTAAGKRDCCSGDKIDQGTEGEKNATPAYAPATHPLDTDESHYAHEALLGIGGMTCERCAASVASALNSVPNTWATVRLQGGSAKVLCKDPIERETYAAAVEKAGYRLVACDVKR